MLAASYAGSASGMADAAVAGPPDSAAATKISFIVLIGHFL
jgi:hypothetical protein